MNEPNLGNRLYGLVSAARAALFEQGELAQLTYGAFDISVRALEAWEDEEITVELPIGYGPDRRAMTTTRTYNKDELRSRYQYLALQQLAINGLMQLVTLVEALFADLLRAVVLRYPKKLGSKRTLTLEAVFEASTVEELHAHATDQLLNDLSYKSPAVFAESIGGLLSINIMECPAYHKYIELKATRDVYVHNRGVANDIYVRKAGSHSRVRSGTTLPLDAQYFLEGYEVCLQLTEWLEEQLHERWYSSQYEEQQRQLQLPLIEPPSQQN